MTSNAPDMDRPLTGDGGTAADGGQTVQAPSLHGANAAKRQAITELLFFASVGDLARCKKLVHMFLVQLSDPKCCDYDKRTPLHLAAAEGAYSVCEWLVQEGANVNSIDRFHRTPLEDAVRGDHGNVAGMLIKFGGKVTDQEQKLIDLSDSPIGKAVRIFDPKDFNQDWEIEPSSLKKICKIGEGEFGVVFKANWHGTIVAVKELKDCNQMALGDFCTELNVMQKVHHPNAVQFLGACTRKQPYCIVTEYMEGGSLLDVFNMNSDRLTIKRAIEFAHACACGMAYLHNRSPQQVIHRDLKPANLMIGGHQAGTAAEKRNMWLNTGVMKLADFGLSKTLQLQKVQPENPQKYIEAGVGVPGAPGENGKATRDHSFKLTGETGSYRYMAPEVFRHDKYNNKVDVYAFSMIAYQLFQGVAPFWQYHPISAAEMAALNNQRPAFSLYTRHGEKVPPALRKLVEECWHPDPDMRPDFLEIVERLDAIHAEVKEASKGEKKSKGGESADDKAGCACSVM